MFVCLLAVLGCPHLFPSFSLLLPATHLHSHMLFGFLKKLVVLDLSTCCQLTWTTDCRFRDSVFLSFCFLSLVLPLRPLISTNAVASFHPSLPPYVLCARQPVRVCYCSSSSSPSWLRLALWCQQHRAVSGWGGLKLLCCFTGCHQPLLAVPTLSPTSYGGTMTLPRYSPVLLHCSYLLKHVNHQNNIRCRFLWPSKLASSSGLQSWVTHYLSQYRAQTLRWIDELKDVSDTTGCRLPILTRQPTAEPINGKTGIFYFWRRRATV